LHLVTLIDTHTHTLGNTPLDKGSAHHRDLYLTTHISYKRQTFTPLVGFEPALPASEWSQTHAIDYAVIGTGCVAVTRYSYY